MWCTFAARLDELRQTYANHVGGWCWMLAHGVNMYSSMHRPVQQADIVGNIESFKVGKSIVYCGEPRRSRMGGRKYG